tara:strand:+ start:775 stop:1242 length:468 start_codon:yes stop_codon:yes gene_type:complete
MSDMKIITNCPLCEERSLHVIGQEDYKIQQCIACGYVTNDNYKGKMKDNELWKSLTDDMKKWSKEALNHIWIPTIMTLPDFMLYPFNDEDGKMKWGLADMIDIPPEDRKDYPIEGKEGQFYTRKYDTDKATIYPNFYEALDFVNNRAKDTENKNG